MKFKDDSKMIPIWGDQIPGNTGASKKDIMNPDLSLTMPEIFGMKGGIWDKSDDVITQMRGDDTLVWKDEIENGYARETYDDVPFLVPFLVEGSKQCVISCPGGAYLSKSVESEGEDIAAFLNAHGISCFVLWYRTHPYHVPLMYLDLQRAVRFLRFHAAEYGFDPDKISTIGFSAGGNLNGVTAIKYKNLPVSYPGYTPDEIDAVDGRANAVAMCYPAINLEHDKALACIVGIENYNDTAKRKELADSLCMIQNIDGECPPLFISCCEDDDVVPPRFAAMLTAEAMGKGVSVETHVFPKGGHGFGGCVVRPTPWGTLPDYTAVEQWKNLYLNWLDRTFA